MNRPSLRLAAMTLTDAVPRRLWFALAAGVSGFLIPVGFATAESLVAERAFPVGGACYGRTYDAAHLARHPGQVVTGLHLWGSSRGLIKMRSSSGPVDPELALTLRVDFADGASAQGEVGCVEEGGRIRRCGREASCSGGFAVQALADGRLQIVNDDAASRMSGSISVRPGFSPDGGCLPADRAGRFVPPDPQNRVFRLDRLPLAACTKGGTAR